ncbi:MAG: inorganic phosphate transporter [Magnetococcales bacterium]|nr:inorganic phosphate transporter [Magnetococcales bacterium]
MDLALILTLLTILAVLIFDFTNGFHDASNMTASVVACSAMTPIRAVLLVSFCTMIGPLLGGTAVANTIGKIIIVDHLSPITSTAIILSAVLAASTWNLLTWWFGLPSSSSHALVGGLVGATLAATGADYVLWGTTTFLTTGKLVGFTKVLASLILSPILGGLAGFIVYKIGYSILTLINSPSINKYLKWSQYITTAGISYAHGTNDAQKSMGIIAMVLLINGFTNQFTVPTWVILLSAIMITAGTLLGGWRIVRTLAFGIYKIRPMHAMESQLASGLLVLGASDFGAPVSTTHVVSSTILGIGAAERPKRIRWSMAAEIVITWIITIPSSAVVASILYLSLAWLIN